MTGKLFMSYTWYFVTFLTNSVFATVDLVQTSPDGVEVCPGNDLVYTCTTKSGALFWEVLPNPFLILNSPSQINISMDFAGFTIILLNISDTTFVSTATLHNVNLANDSIEIGCSDGGVPKSKEVRIAGAPTRSTNGTITINYDRENQTLTFDWDSPPGNMCIERYEVSFIGSLPRCNFSITTLESVLKIPAEMFNSSCNFSKNFITSVDGANRSGPIEIFAIGDPDSIDGPMIESTSSCVNNEIDITLSVDWEDVQSDITELGIIGYYVFLNITNFTTPRFVIKSEVEYNITIELYIQAYMYIQAYIVSTNGFRNGSEVSVSGTITKITCRTPSSQHDACESPCIVSVSVSVSVIIFFSAGVTVTVIAVLQYKKSKREIKA